MAKKARKAKLEKNARRSASARRSKLLVAPGKAMKRGPQTKPQAKSGSRSLEIQLRKTVAELGLTEARKIFASVEAAFAD